MTVMITHVITYVQKLSELACETINAIILSTTNLEWNRYLGTLLANLNFQLNSNEEKDSDNEIQKLTNSKKNVAGSVLSLQLEKDLSKLLGRIVHTNEMPLIDMLMLLGYSSSIQRKSNGVLHSKASKEFVTTNCSSETESNNLGMIRIDDMPRFKHGGAVFQPQHDCNFNLYIERWNFYLQSLSDETDDDRRKCVKGIHIHHHYL